MLGAGQLGAIALIWSHIGPAISSALLSIIRHHYPPGFQKTLYFNKSLPSHMFFRKSSPHIQQAISPVLLSIIALIFNLLKHPKIPWDTAAIFARSSRPSVTWCSPKPQCSVSTSAPPHTLCIAQFTQGASHPWDPSMSGRCAAEIPSQSPALNQRLDAVESLGRHVAECILASQSASLNASCASVEILCKQCDLIHASLHLVHQ